MGKFIYVIGEDARDYLITMGYHLLSRNGPKHIYVFLNQTGQNFSCTDIKFVVSDTLTF